MWPSAVTPDEHAARTVLAETVEQIFERYPRLARRVGRHEFDGRMPTVEPRLSGEVERLRRTARSCLEALPDDADPELRADMGTAVVLLDEEHFRATALGETHRGALDWFSETDVNEYVRTPYAPVEQRLAAVGAHLAQVPSFLQQVSGHVPQQLPAGQRLAGIESAVARAAEIETVVSGLTAAHPALAADRLVEDGAAAAAACREFAQVITATAPAKALLTPDLLTGLLIAAEGADFSPADLLGLVRAEVGELTSALDRVVAGLGASHRPEAYQMLADTVSDRPVLDELRATVDRIRDFWTTTGDLPFATETPVEIRHSAATGGRAAIEFSVAAPLGSYRGSHVLSVPDLGAAGAAAETLRRHYLNDCMLELIAVHEMFPGHYVQHEAALRGPSAIRTCIPWFPGFTEGWAHYTEELAIERGLAEGRPLVRLAQLKLALEAATRLLVYLSLHLRTMTFAEATERAAVLCDWSPARAAREVIATASDPSGAMYALGKLQIRQWRDSSSVGRTSEDLRRFHDRLLRCGNAPLSVARRYHLDGTSDPRGTPELAAAPGAPPVSGR